MFNVQRRDLISFDDFVKSPEKAGELVQAPKGGFTKNKKKYRLLKIKAYLYKRYRTP